MNNEDKGFAVPNSSGSSQPDKMGNGISKDFETWEKCACRTFGLGAKRVDLFEDRKQFQLVPYVEAVYDAIQSKNRVGRQDSNKVKGYILVILETIDDLNEIVSELPLRDCIFNIDGINYHGEDYMKALGQRIAALVLDTSVTVTGTRSMDLEVNLKVGSNNPRALRWTPEEVGLCVKYLASWAGNFNFSAEYATKPDDGRSLSISVANLMDSDGYCRSEGIPVMVRTEASSMFARGSFTVKFENRKFTIFSNAFDFGQSQSQNAGK